MRTFIEKKDIYKLDGLFVAKVKDDKPLQFNKLGANFYLLEKGIGRIIVRANRIKNEKGERVMEEKVLVSTIGIVREYTFEEFVSIWNNEKEDECYYRLLKPKELYSYIEEVLLLQSNL